jgi:UDP-N-acetyl-D-galactosamine dehydrogenase
VVFAVAHQDFIDEGWPLIKSLLKGGKGVVADVKGRLPRARVPAGISLWRL